MATETCTDCEGVGYLIGREGELAQAAVCRCQQSCSTCAGEGFLLSRQDGYEIALPCNCRKVQRRVLLYNEAGIPAKFSEKSLSDFEARRFNGRLKMKLLDYQSGFDIKKSKGLLLVGAPGTGKTHLMTAVLHYLTLERGIPCRFIDFFNLTALIRSTYRDDANQNEAGIIDPLVNIPVLAIDEMGKGQGTTWELSIVDQLISRRYNAGRLVLATSNYYPARLLDGAKTTKFKHSAEQLNMSIEERVGSRIYSRLSETCDVEVVEGMDYRQQAR
jgi:DNA replication protein DnaC